LCRSSRVSAFSTRAVSMLDPSADTSPRSSPGVRGPEFEGGSDRREQRFRAKDGEETVHTRLGGGRPPLPWAGIRFSSDSLISIFVRGEPQTSNRRSLDRVLWRRRRCAEVHRRRCAEVHRRLRCSSGFHWSLLRSRCVTQSQCQSLIKRQVGGTQFPALVLSSAAC